jgi:hypothetical protein
MKKTLLFLMLMAGVFTSVRAQTHYGTGAGTIGPNHSYFGYYAGNATTSSGGYNSFFGARCGQKTTTGYSNTAIGSYAFYDNTEGFYNTVVGNQALSNNVYGTSNVAIGKQALFTSNYYGDNTANGYRALYATTDGLYNTATGAFALRDNTSGSYNTATGFQALYNNTTPDYNVATGAFAMVKNITGEKNSAYGIRALSTTSGSLNSAFGSQALYSDASSCAGSYNTAFGVNAGFASLGSCNLNNTTALGYLAKVTASNQVRIGNSEVTSIGGQVSWSTLSDGRFKKDLKNDVSGLDFINELNPVSYTVDKLAVDKFLGIPDSLRVKHDETRQMPQYQVGFVAQEVEAVIKKSGYVFSGVEEPKSESDTYTIRYAEFVVPLVKAIQELSEIADAREREIGELKQVLSAYLDETPDGEKGSSDVTRPFIDYNSFSGSTEFNVELPAATAQANLMIYDLEGKELKDIALHERGRVGIKILSNEFNPGAYLYALIADGEVVAISQFDLK